MNSSIIIDTGFIYALYSKRDSNHQKAKEAAVKYNSMEWVTTCFVFHEMYWLLNETNPIQIFEAEKAGIFQVVNFERDHLLEIEKNVNLGSYLNGAVLTETIFGWDGLGRYALEGIMKRDYPVIMGVVLFGAVVFVSLNLLVDISYHFLDPRVRIKKEG